MEFDDDYLERDRCYRANILGGDNYDDGCDDGFRDYGDMEEQGYDAVADDDVYDSVPRGGYRPNVFGNSRYNEEEDEETVAMQQRVWRDYHVLGYAEDDGDDRDAEPHASRRESQVQPSQIAVQQMSQKCREAYAKRAEEQEAARIIRTNRAVCIAAAAAVLISLLLILL